MADTRKLTLFPQNPYRHHDNWRWRSGIYLLSGRHCTAVLTGVIRVRARGGVTRINLILLAAMHALIYLGWRLEQNYLFHKVKMYTKIVALYNRWSTNLLTTMQ